MRRGNERQPAAARRAPWVALALQPSKGHPQANPEGGSCNTRAAVSHAPRGPCGRLQRVQRAARATVAAMCWRLRTPSGLRSRPSPGPRCPWRNRLRRPRRNRKQGEVVGSPLRANNASKRAQNGSRCPGGNDPCCSESRDWGWPAPGQPPGDLQLRVRRRHPPLLPDLAALPCHGRNWTVPAIGPPHLAQTPSAALAAAASQCSGYPSMPDQARA
mmetsp:Transcript_10772/g.33626  ORF Transcript_10772/g.33626 Transcript_10772/m.33626 type:complete len:216 (+) Transcript_10772:358-1005(+)